jgi:glycosyltransferase involved in cell wall biosynthesis
VPRVTAAITTHNRARYLPDAIESVLGQTFADVEVLVVDDGSTDETADVLAPYRDRIRYFRQDNQGRAGARNTAVLLARGELIGFCDSDDRWMPDRLERQLEVLERRPEVGMVHGQVELTDHAWGPLAEQTEAHRALFSSAHAGGATYAGYACNCRCLSSTILVRREVFETVGLYDARLPIEDYDLYLRLLLEFEIAFLDWPPLAQYRMHTPGETEPLQLALGQIRTAEKHLALLDERRDIPDARVARRNFNLMIARSWRVLGERRRARAAALRALRLGAPEALRVAL